MFVIVYNGSVILGPMRWNRFRFENEIKEECEVSVTLNDRNDNFDPVIVSDDIQILPIQGTQNPDFNPKIEFLNGPFWEFTSSVAIMYYRVERYTVDAVKNTLKSQCAAERYRRETLGVKTVIQDVEVSVDTSRGNRDIFVQKYILMSDADTVRWKFPEGWLTLSKIELGQIVAIGSTHVQAQFDWEASKIVEIEQCSTLEELNSIVIEEQNENPNRI